MTAADVAMIFIVDDDPQVRAAIQGLLESAGLGSECFETAEQFMQRKHLDHPSCLILDVSLPGIGGLDFQQLLKNAGIEIPIIFVTGHGDIPMTVKAMKSGAMEFLTKPVRDRDLLEAVTQALDRDCERREGDEALAVLQKHYKKLTPREREVMALVVSGMLNKTIASELTIKEITVKIHRSRVMRKMQAASLAQLVRMAEKLRLFRYNNSRFC
jgi:FixJ family two-component response regulator